MKRWIWVFVLLLVIAAGIYLGFRPQPTQVEAVRAAKAPLRVTVEEEAKTRLRTRYVVSAPVAGFVRRLRWKAGDVVKAGQAVAEVDPAKAAALDARTREQAEARVKVAQASLTVAEARLAAQREQVKAAQADRDYWKKQQQREETLRKSGDIAAAQLDKTMADLLRSEANLAAVERSVVTASAEVSTARAEIAAARTALENFGANPAPGAGMAVIAPAGGRVIRVIRESEGAVNAGDGLLELGDAHAIEVVSEVLSADAVRIAPGMRVLLTRWGGDGVLEARVRVVEPGGFTKISALGVEEQRVRVVADITSPEEQWRRLGDGYRVEAAFVLWEGASVLQVPANAVFRFQDGWALFADDAGLARRRMVQVGHRSGAAVEILSGLAEGDLVILHPDETVEDGKAVQPDRK